MQQKKGRRALSNWSSWRILWVLGLFVAVATAGMIVSQQLLLDNARTMGKNLVTSYSNDEDNQFNTYDRILTLAMYYMEDMVNDGVDTTEFENWLADFFEKSADQEPGYLRRAERTGHLRRGNARLGLRLSESVLVPAGHGGGG